MSEPTIEEMRRILGDARLHFLTEVKGAIVDIDEKAHRLAAAIGEVSPEEAAAALADYAEERFGLIRNKPPGDPR